MKQTKAVRDQTHPITGKNWGWFMAILFVMVGCQREIDVDLLDKDRVVVLSGVWMADSTPIYVSLSYSQYLSDTLMPATIADAIVNIFCNGQYLCAMDNLGNGMYASEMVPISGNTYKVEAMVNDTVVWAETKIPNKVNIVNTWVDSVLHWSIYRYQYYFTILDDAKTTDYYWCWMTQEPTEKLDYVASGSPYFDDFSRIDSPGANAPFYDFDFGKFARLPDVRFNGQEYSFDLVHCWSRPNYHLAYVHINSFDEHYDKYLKSYLTYNEFLHRTDDMPIYYKPSFVYSNVHNGTGILGSMSCYTKYHNHK